MKFFHYGIILVLVILFKFSISVASDIEVYWGTVRSSQGDRLNLLLKNGGEKSVRMNKDTKVFASGRVVPYKRIKLNSYVQAAVSADGLCLQVVVEEGPK